jgi:mRNA interferase RelE/StbE
VRHTIQFKESALRTLEGLNKPIRSRIARRIEALADQPRPADVKVLQGGDGDLRIRVGDYRIVYRVDGKKLIVLIIRIGHRREVYRTR